MSKLDLTKPYRTRNGKEAHAVEGPDGWLYGYHMGGANGIKSRTWWRPDGAFNQAGYQNEFDLVAVPETRTIKVWINIYDEPSVPLLIGPSTWGTREEADGYCLRSLRRIACIEREISFEVGEGIKP